MPESGLGSHRISNVPKPGRWGREKKHLKLSTQAANTHTCAHTCTHRIHTCTHTLTQKDIHTETCTYMCKQTETQVHTHTLQGLSGSGVHGVSGRVLLSHEDHRAQVNPGSPPLWGVTTQGTGVPDSFTPTRVVVKQLQRTGRPPRVGDLPRAPQPSEAATEAGLLALASIWPQRHPGPVRG